MSRGAAAMALCAALTLASCATPSIPDGNRYEFAFATPEDCAVVLAVRQAWPLTGRSEAITGLIRFLEPAGGSDLAAALGPPSSQDRVGPINLSNCPVAFEGDITAGAVSFLTPVYSQDRTMALTGVSPTPDQWRVALLVREPQGWRVRKWETYRPKPPPDPREVQ